MKRMQREQMWMLEYPWRRRRRQHMSMEEEIRLHMATMSWTRQSLILHRKALLAKNLPRSIIKIKIKIEIKPS